MIVLVLGASVDMSLSILGLCPSWKLGWMPGWADLGLWGSGDGLFQGVKVREYELVQRQKAQGGARQGALTDEYTID